LPANLELARGQVGHLVATVLPENAANRAVFFASSNASVATVDERGAVTALALGTATITVTAAEGGHTAESRVVVGPPRVETNIAVDTVTTLTQLSTAPPKNARKAPLFESKTIGSASFAFVKTEM